MPNLSTMNRNYKKSIVWFMLAMYLMLVPVPQWNNGDWVLCLKNACADGHDGISLKLREGRCARAEDACGKSCGYGFQISDLSEDNCFCCVDIPISTYTKVNTPLSSINDPTGGIQNVLAPSLPDNHPLLNKTLFPISPNLHLISTKKTLRSVILII
jgi:hypothetical protein